jgi:ABC-type Fe3+-siderophore transport system permease subunit
MEHARFRGRALTALLMLLGFAGLTVSGLVLYFAPRGRVADVSGWDLMGLTRWQWADLHTCFVLLMFVAAIPHLWMNRHALLNYLRRKVAATTPLRGVRFEVIAAAALCVLLLVVTVWQVPPVSYVLQLRSEMRGTPEPGPPPFAGGRRGWRASE